MDTHTPTSNTNYQVNYNPALIQLLHKEHLLLNATLQTIEKFISENAIPEAIKQLAPLKSKILEHVSKEELMLYSYLQQSLKNTPDSYTQMRHLRKKMNNDIIKVLAFLNTYINSAPETIEADTFATNFKTIKTLYGKRMLIEENGLFPLYKKE